MCVSQESSATKKCGWSRTANREVLTLGVFLLNFCLVIHSDGDLSHLLLVRATSVDTAMPFSLIRSAREVGKVSSNLVFIALKEFFGHRINMYPFNRTDQVI